MSEKVHVLKLNEMFVEDVVHGDKRVEVRKDDRMFQRGDLMRFVVVDDDGNHPSKYTVCSSALEALTYRITYVEHGYGIEPGYCAFSFEEVSE